MYLNTPYIITIIHNGNIYYIQKKILWDNKSYSSASGVKQPEPGKPSDLHIGSKSSQNIFSQAE